MTDIANLQPITKQFGLPKIERVTPLTQGNINITLQVAFADNAHDDVVLQKINPYVFPDPKRMMENIARITQHIDHKLRDDPQRFRLQLLPTTDGQTYVEEDGELWRIWPLVHPAQAFDACETPEQAQAIASAFSEFVWLCSDLPNPDIICAIPGYRDTLHYLELFHDAVANDAHKRLASVGREVDVVEQFSDLATLILVPLRRGELPARVIHNDTKLNNVLLSPNNEALCVIDLDAIATSSPLFDFGDLLRAGACTVSEDHPDPNQVGFDFELFKAFSKGYWQHAHRFLMPQECQLMVPSIQLIAFELGMRFLTDYLNGDVYFQAQHPEHNLQRARVQFALLGAVIQQTPQLSDWLNRYINSPFEA